MVHVALHLLGIPSLLCSISRQKISLPYAKLTMLIAYLALENKAHSREFLADLFWPNLNANDSRANLRRALFNIQQAFEKVGIRNSFIQADRNSICISKENLWIDVSEFEEYLKNALSSSIYPPPTLYMGSFMDGIFPASERLERWIVNKRIQYEQKHISLLENLIVRLNEQGNFVAMIQYCQQLISIDCVNELAYSFLIRRNMNCGNCIVARKIFNLYCHALDVELGMQPSLQLMSIVGLL